MDKSGKGEAVGQVIVFTGLGTGKTSSALGVTLRTVAQGGKVIFIYFTASQLPVLGRVKATAFNGNWRIIGIKSEVKDIPYLGEFIEVVDTVEEALAMASRLWLHECDLLVLDDIGLHLNSGVISATQVLAIIDNRPPNTSIILTGSSLPDPILKRADLVTEFLKIK